MYRIIIFIIESNSLHLIEIYRQFCRFPIFFALAGVWGWSVARQNWMKNWLRSHWWLRSPSLLCRANGYIWMAAKLRASHSEGPLIHCCHFLRARSTPFRKPGLSITWFIGRIFMFSCRLINQLIIIFDCQNYRKCAVEYEPKKKIREKQNQNNRSINVSVSEPIG